MLKAIKVRNNLIIPCGTSQVEDSKLDKLGITSAAIRDRVKDDRFSILSSKAQAYLADTETQEVINEIAEELIRYLPDRHKNVPIPDKAWIGWWEENPFGAELSTLIRLENKSEWNPGKDRIVLLASETKSGLMAREVVAKVLRDFDDWEVQHLKTDTVEKLEEYTHNPITAELNLVNLVYQYLCKSSEGWRNQLVVTGGFKSLIPCLTVFAILYGLELVYLFERSTIIQRNSFIDLADSRVRQSWRSAWIDYNRQNVLHSYLKQIVSMWLNKTETKEPGPIFD